MSCKTLIQGGLFVIGHVRVGELGDSGDPLAEEHNYWLKLIDHLKVSEYYMRVIDFPEVFYSILSFHFPCNKLLLASFRYLFRIIKLIANF